MKRTTILLADADRAAIQAIKNRFGVSSDSDAIRLALRVLAGVDNTGALLPPISEPPAPATGEIAGGEMAGGECSAA